MSLEQKIKTITQEIAVIERSGTLEELSKALFEKKRLQKELDLTPTSYDRFVIKQLLDPVVAEHPVWDSFFGARLKNTLIAWGSATQVVEVIKLHIGHWAIVIDSPKGELAHKLNEFCSFADADKVIKRHGQVRYLTIIRAESSEKEKETGIRLSDDWWREATTDQDYIDVWIGRNRLERSTEEQVSLPKGKDDTMFVFRTKNGDYVSLDMSFVTQVKRNTSADFLSTVIFICNYSGSYTFECEDVFAAQRLVTAAIEFQAKIGRVGFVQKPTDYADVFLDKVMDIVMERDIK